jgi:hypothetical protein
MKSPNLDSIYHTLDKHVLLTQSYTEINELFFIIKSCRLKPYDFIFGSRSNKLILFRNWFDEFGNSLEILPNKKIKIVYNDLSIDQSKIVCTDLYYGLSLNRIAKMSKLAHFYCGKDEDLYHDCVCATFLGIDNYLRTYVYVYDEWQRVSPLLLGIKNLATIGANRDIKFFRKIAIKEKGPIPCISVGQWLTFMPASPDFKALLEKQYDIVSSIFTKE